MIRTTNARTVPGALTDEMVAAIDTVVGADDRVREIILFGSRAKGTWREGSDIDLAVVGENLERRDVRRWSESLEEILFPWSVDIVVMDEHLSPELRGHIERCGVALGDA